MAALQALVNETKLRFDPGQAPSRLLKIPMQGMRLMEHVWLRVPSHCLIASQPDSR